MTIAISVKVHEGIVLATDSAASMIYSLPNGMQVIENVYNNANKIHNLRKGLPIGAMVWGAGSIGATSMGTLVRDLRVIFTDGDDTRPEYAGWKIDPKSYTIQMVAERTRDFLLKSMSDLHAAQPTTAPISFGMLVAGFSSGAPLAESWLIDIVQGQVTRFCATLSNEPAGLDAYAQAESVFRLLYGVGTQLPTVLLQITNNPQLVDGWMQLIRQQLVTGVVSPSMPIQDAIDLADWLVHNAIMYSRFLPGAATVGGPIEIAVVTKHEGFKWIKRKHYYESSLNPQS